ncbi:MAG: 2-amino-4-hydroxy-6-hydroxymethyldihydropteridine diphosphokinase [Ferruginibacter sp.]|nr:2-amino-4-hydroxy-6-hydroxymethyldihydropteridine diphosphokinase [Ferruginibacter sp.]
MNIAYILLGSNMGNSAVQLNEAIKNITENIGIIRKESSIYSTAAWGNTEQPNFLNKVLIIETICDAKNLLKKTLHIETKMGRVRTTKNAPRIIDIDILFFNNEIIGTKNLVIPHPEIANRRFVLVPLAEIAMDFVHPVSKKSIKNMLLECKDTLNVQKI